MTMTRKEMMDAIIKKFGFEDSRTITFCALCEDNRLSDSAIYKSFKELIKMEGVLYMTYAKTLIASQLRRGKVEKAMELALKHDISVKEYNFLAKKYLRK